MLEGWCQEERRFVFPFVQEKVRGRESSAVEWFRGLVQKVAAVLRSRNGLLCKPGQIASLLRASVSQAAQQGCKTSKRRLLCFEVLS